MRKDLSVGGIVFNDKRQILLVKGVNRGYWLFPKGHVHSGETQEQAAVREVAEEGGVKVDLIKKIGETNYIFTTPSGEKVDKKVIYFLMRYVSGDPKDHDDEVSDAKWFGFDEALEIIDFPQNADFLRKVVETEKI